MSRTWRQKRKDGDLDRRPPQCIRVVRSEGAGCRYGTEEQEDESVACDDKVQGQLVPCQQMASLAYG